jgi:hypothetical protein
MWPWVIGVAPVMIRTQIQLTSEQAARLKAVATRRGVSMAELIREGVERVLAESQQEERRRRALAVAGRFRGPRDLGRNHDAYLSDAFSGQDAE